MIEKIDDKFSFVMQMRHILCSLIVEWNLLSVEN